MFLSRWSFHQLWFLLHWSGSYNARCLVQCWMQGELGDWHSHIHRKRPTLDVDSVSPGPHHLPASAGAPLTSHLQLLHTLGHFLGSFGSARVVRGTVSPDDPADASPHGMRRRDGKGIGWGLLSGHAPYSLLPSHRLLFLSPNVLSSVLPQGLFPGGCFVWKVLALTG